MLTNYKIPVGHVLSISGNNSWEIMLLIKINPYIKEKPYGLNRLVSTNNWKDIPMPHLYTDDYYGHITGIASNAFINPFKAWQQKK